jgi:hypothetical protein
MPWNTKLCRDFQERDELEFPKKDGNSWKWSKYKTENKTSSRNQFSYPAVIRTDLPDLRGEKPKE